jgi:hypothetical protein
MKYFVSILFLLPLALCIPPPAPATELTRGELAQAKEARVETSQTDGFIIHHYNKVSNRRPYSKKVCVDITPIEQECHAERRYKVDQGVMYSHSTISFWDSKIQQNVTLKYNRDAIN